MSNNASPVLAECSISSVENRNSAKKTFQCNWIGDIMTNLSEWSNISEVEPLQHVPSNYNIIDIATRPNQLLTNMAVVNWSWQKCPILALLKERALALYQ